MPYNTKLVDRIRAYLVNFPNLAIEEKKMFGGLAFMVNGKMCVNVSKDRIMCRFDPNLEEEIAEKIGHEPMIMKGKTLKGYCYVNPEGFRNQEDWEKLLNNFWTDAKNFATLIEQLPENKLWEDFTDQKYGNYFRNIQGIIEHSHYHLGQIVLIKKIIYDEL